jgi:hypothetical protein
MSLNIGDSGIFTLTSTYHLLTFALVLTLNCGTIIPKSSRKGLPRMSDEFLHLLDGLDYAYKYSYPHVMKEYCHILIAYKMYVNYVGLGTLKRDIQVTSFFNGMTLCDLFYFVLDLNFVFRFIVVFEQMSSERDQLSYNGSSTEPVSFDNDHTIFMKEVIEVLPQECVLISMSYCEDSQSIYVSRQERNNEAFVVKLPLHRHAVWNGDDEFLNYTDAVAELNNILDESASTTNHSTEIKTKEYKVEWWRKRQNLDERMKKLLLNIEQQWLGGFKVMKSRETLKAKLTSVLKGVILPGFLCPHATEDSMVSKVQGLIRESLGSMKGFNNREGLVIGSSVIRSLLRYRDSITIEDVEEFVYFMFDALQLKGYSIDYENVDSVCDSLKPRITFIY